MVAPRLDLPRQPDEDALPVVLDQAGLSVQQRFRGADLAAERLDDRLMAEAQQIIKVRLAKMVA